MTRRHTPDTPTRSTLGSPRPPRRRVLTGTAAALAAAAGAGTLASCGSAAAEGTVELDYWLWDANQLPGYAEAIDLFMAQNPDIRVRITQMGWDDYWTKLTASFVAEAGPDLFTDHLGRYPEFLRLGVIAPLGEYPEVAALEEGTFQEGLRELWTGQDGLLYGVPKDFDTIALMYDRTVIEEAGLTPEDLAELEWNPEDGGSFERVLARLSVDENGVRGDEEGFDPEHVAVYGMAADAGIDYTGQTSWSPFALSTGWFFTEEDTWGTRFRYDDERFQQTLDWYFGLVDKGFFPPFGLFGDSSPAQTQLQGGSSAIAVAGSWMIGTYASLEGVDLGIAPLPRGPIGTPMSMFNGLGDSLSAQSEHPQEAARLAAFLASSDAQEIIGGRAVVFPSTPVGTEAAVAAYEEQGLDVSPFTDRVDQGETGLYPLVENAAQIASLLQPVIDRLWMRQTDASAFTGYNEQVNALFE